MTSTPSNFRHTVLKALAWLSEQTPGRGVHRNRIREAVLFMEGINPTQSPIPLKGKKPVGLYRKIGFAFRNQRVGYNPKVYTELLTDGTWAITKAGLDSLGRGKRCGPTPNFLKQHVLETLVVLSGQQANTAVQYKDVLTEVLNRFGVNPQTTLLPLKGREGIYRDINLAFRSMRQGYCRKGTAPQVKQRHRSVWMVTQAGLDAVLGKRCCITADWLAKRPPQFHDALLRALRTKLPHSVRLGIIEDHLSAALEKWISRDAFKDRIAANRPPTVSECCQWAVRSAFTDIRGNGKDALGYSQGAKTTTTRARLKRELEVLNKATVRETFEAQLPAPDRRTCLCEDQLDFIDVTGCDPFQFTEIKETIGAMLHVLQCEKKGKYKSLFRKHFLEGHTLQEIADEEGVELRKITMMVRELRKILISARESGRLGFSLIHQRDQKKLTRERPHQSSQFPRP